MAYRESFRVDDSLSVRLYHCTENHRAQAILEDGFRNGEPIDPLLPVNAHMAGVEAVWFADIPIGGIDASYGHRILAVTLPKVTAAKFANFSKAEERGRWREWGFPAALVNPLVEDAGPLSPAERLAEGWTVDNRDPWAAMRLYHGTTAAAVPLILRDGFNTEDVWFSTARTTRYGKGRAMIAVDLSEETLRGHLGWPRSIPVFVFLPAHVANALSIEHVEWWDLD